MNKFRENAVDFFIFLPDNRLESMGHQISFVKPDGLHDPVLILFPRFSDRLAQLA